MTGPIDPTAPLTPEGSGAPQPAEGPPRRRARSTVVWIALAILVLGSAIGAGVALLLSGGDEGGEVGVATSTSVASGTSTTAPTVTTTAAPTPTAAVPAPGETTVPTEAAAPTTTTTFAHAVPLPPVITQLQASPTSITCLPGQTVQVTLSWTTQRATEVRFTVPATSLGSLPPNGSTILSFNCTPGVTPQNKPFSLSANGLGGTTSGTVTVHVTIT